MPRTACVFVDGENFRHSIVELFRDDFTQDAYLPKRAEWARLFDHLVEEVAPGGERRRTYWYVVESLDFYPYRFSSPEEKPEELKTLLCKHEEFRKLLISLRDVRLIEEMKRIVGDLENRRRSMRRRFDGWTVIQNGICLRHPSIEFRRAGAICYNLFSQTLGTEKAVDVKLACDLIVLRDIYDVAIIVSGDQDYVPAVQVVKDYGKSVVNVGFKTRSGKLLPGGARRLNVVTDWSIQLAHDDFKAFLSL